MSKFLDNFLGGFTFGMLASNPLFGGCFGFGMYPMYRCMNFGGFANPFPSVFGNMGFSSMTAQIPPSTFANAEFPAVDFHGVCQTIWDTYTNPDSNYNKQMREYYKQMEEQSKNSNNSSAQRQYIPQFQYPFSSFYTPLQYNMNPFGIYYNQNQKELNDGKKEEKKDYLGNREFAQAYASLGITDKRFQKMFEECILSLNEGRKNGKDFYTFDVKAMNKNGVLQLTYDEYREKIKKLPKRDVKNMTIEEMCDIYYTMFYVKGGAKDIKDDRLALYVFDSDVNMGTGTGKILLEKSGNNAAKFEEERKKEYKNRKGFNTYGEGWLERVEKTKKYADNNFSAVA